MYLGSILTSYIEYQPKDANMSIELLKVDLTEEINI